MEVYFLGIHFVDRSKTNVGTQMAYAGMDDENEGIHHEIVDGVEIATVYTRKESENNPYDCDIITRYTTDEEFLTTSQTIFLGEISEGHGGSPLPKEK